MIDTLSFTVYGHAAPAGSKRAFPAGGKKGGRVVVVDDSRRSRPWKQEVAGVAREAMADRELFDGPLVLELHFYVPRPRSHFGKRGLLPSAPAWPAKRPDLLKLARGVEDALSTIVYRDDAQIVVEYLAKAFDEPERLEVVVMPASTFRLSDAATEAAA